MRRGILPDGNFQFQFQTLCSTGLVLTVQTSTNLLVWQPVQTFTNLTPVTTYTDTNTGAALGRFYRMVVP